MIQQEDSNNSDTLESRFEEPTSNNVELGDYLVTSGHGLNPALVSIIEISKDEFQARVGNLTAVEEYSKSIILKQNGAYLIGSEVLDNLLKQEAIGETETAPLVPS